MKGKSDFHQLPISILFKNPCLIIVYDNRKYMNTKHRNGIVNMVGYRKSLESMNCHVSLKMSRTALSIFGIGELHIKWKNTAYTYEMFSVSISAVTTMEDETEAEKKPNGKMISQFEQFV